MKRTVIVPGQRYGLLTAIAESRSGKNVYWQCRCDCGVVKEARATSLARGVAKSCGRCWSRMHTTKHGLSRSGAYKSWHAMIRRCTDPTDAGYRWYGARGVTVCERWFLFENFVADMGDRSAGLSIDRIDPNGNYEPSNCRWATAAVQARNKRLGKLTLMLASQIRLMATMGYTKTFVARCFSVSQSLVSRIASGDCWSVTRG